MIEDRLELERLVERLTDLEQIRELDQPALVVLSVAFR